MKTASRKKAAPATSFARVAVPVRIPAAHLKTFRFFCEAYELPLGHLLQEQAYAEADCILDMPFSMLEMLDETPPAPDGEEIALEFCPVAHEILSRLAILLRRPLPEFLQGLLHVSHASFRRSMDDALKEEDGINGPDMESWADEAIKFERLARRNKTPTSRGNTGWIAFGIEKPSARKARAALR